MSYGNLILIIRKDFQDIASIFYNIYCKQQVIYVTGVSIYYPLYSIQIHTQKLIENPQFHYLLEIDESFLDRDTFCFISANNLSIGNFGQAHVYGLPGFFSVELPSWSETGRLSKLYTVFPQPVVEFIIVVDKCHYSSLKLHTIVATFSIYIGVPITIFDYV